MKKATVKIDSRTILRAQIAREILKTNYAKDEYEERGIKDAPELNHDDLSRKAADNIMKLIRK